MDPPNWFHSVGGMNRPPAARDRLRLREGIARRAVLVAAVFEERSVQSVGARLGLLRNHRLAGLSELRVVRRRRDLQLRDANPGSA